MKESKFSETKYQIWTDGSCYYGDRIGAWAFLFFKEGIFFEEFDFVYDTTSARMEMIAILSSLKYCNEKLKGKNIEVFSDYATVVNFFKERWYLEWVEYNYEGIKNDDLWREIKKEAFKGKNKFKFTHVKGHSGIELNERVDFLAGYARKFARGLNLNQEWAIEILRE